MAWLGALLCAAAVWAGAVAGVGWFLEVRLDGRAALVDLALHLGLAAVLFGITRNLRWYLVFVVLTTTLLHVGNGLKIAVLGGPVMPDDVSALRALAMILEGSWRVMAALWVFAAAAALVAGLRFGRRSLAVAASVAAAAVLLAAKPEPVAKTLDRTFGNTVWDQAGNYRQRGPIVHMVQETARHLARSEEPPGRGSTLLAVEHLLRDSGPPARLVAGAAAAPVRPRNVHMIVLESFWDAGLLEGLGLSDDPFDPRFRALWEEAGSPRVLSPVFGGYTANAEFEALCGFPVERDLVVFEAGLSRAAPCLPAWLGSLGYAATASHPNVAAFWNRTNAYRRVGFDVYWSASDFDLDDMNGDFLSDRSLYRQVLEKMEPVLESESPVFNYVLTFFGHLDYPLNELRPEVVALTAGDARVARYVNTVRYKSAELMDFLEQLQARDPEALIVMFGDHLPFLGANFASYAEAGLLASRRGDFDAGMHVLSLATPLLVLDGSAGPVRTGDMPLYRLPSLVRDLLRLDLPVAADLARPPADLLVRPLPGLHVVVDPEGGERVCREESLEDPACALTAEWLRNLRILRRDLFTGRQYVLRDGVLERLGSAPQPGT